jgi:hypothetical protein
MRDLVPERTSRSLFFRHSGDPLCRVLERRRAAHAGRLEA